MSDIRYMPIKEFRELGVLQEVNRRFLHPLGLALEVIQLEDGTEVLGGVWDSRADPEWIVFGDPMDDEKRQRVAVIADAHAEFRQAKFGWVDQPVEEPN